MNKTYTLLLGAAFLALPAMAQQKAEPLDAAIVEKIKQEGLQKSQVMDIAFYLTDVNGPRLSGSTGLAKANQWTKEKLASWGLKNATIEPWGTFGKGWEVEKSYLALTKPYYQPMIGSPKAWTPSTNGPVKGQVVLVKATKEEDLAQYAGKLKGKIVMAEVTNPIKTTFAPDGSRYTDEALHKMAEPVAPSEGRAPMSEERMAQMRARRAFVTKMNEMILSEGAAAILSSRGGSHGTFFTTNGAPYAMDAKPALPEFEIAQEDLARMSRLLSAGIPVEIELESKTRFLTEDPQGYNVIAEIPGSDKKLKSEVVMLGGHIDSWHAATGATDNAAGVAVMMEAVRIIKALNLQPKRTIRIALWGGEEQGLHGSRGYAKKYIGDTKTMALLPQQEKISAYFNLDNGTGKIRGIYTQGNEAVAPLFSEWLKPFNAMGASTVTNRNTGGTDHLSFDALGVPGFQFIQDEIEYNTRTHHTNMDTYDRLQPEDLKQASVIVANFVYQTANRAEKLPRKPMPKPQS
ncbi:peptidase M28 [Rufibacter sp. DG15C]|uniref:M28 family metallopeptidase n=1 Tax=Rufibacter sp. DG15C TaxID=1379909 RepID=UPI00078E6ABF|nr:M20/M25/M40 family metallo-hydrolase [Rufibacter sp. DG15C]AMM51130.1 peptidase M28 [Rufibacter sp. DG15C]